MSALSHAQLSIAQAAVLADFDTDPQAVQYLTEAGSRDFERRVAELRPESRCSTRPRERGGAVARQGYRLLTERPAWNDELFATRWDRLCDGQGNTVSDAVTEHDPQLWAVWLDEVELYEDSRTGEKSTKATSTGTSTPPTTTPHPKGYVHPRFIVQRTVFEPEFFCLDIDAAGVLTRSRVLSALPARRSLATGDTGAENGVMKPNCATSAQSRGLNKLGHAAIEVRRAWVKNHLLARKTPPQGAALFVAWRSWPSTPACSSGPTPPRPPPNCSR